MKKIFMFLMVLILLFSLMSCNKKKTDDNQTADNGTQTEVVEDVTQYVRHSSIVVYATEADLALKANEVPRENKKFLYFGNDVQVVKSKVINKKNYYQVQLPDGSNYWCEKDDLAKRFIIINKKDTKCYNNASDNYITTIKLQPGDYGVLIAEGQDEWIKVDFGAYREISEGGDRKWVGEKWIKEGYTDDLFVAKEAYFLYLANYYTFSKTNTAKAKEMLEKAVEINGGVETEITPVIKETLQQIITESEAGK